MRHACYEVQQNYEVRQDLKIYNRWMQILSETNTISALLVRVSAQVNRASTNDPVYRIIDPYTASVTQATKERFVKVNVSHYVATPEN